MKHLTLTFAVVAMLCCSNFVNGQILLDQAPTGSVNCIVNQDFPDFPDFAAFAVDDVTFAKDVTLGSITLYFTLDANLDGVTWPIDNAGTPHTANLMIFPDDGTLDTEDPATGTIVDVIVDPDDLDGNGFLDVTACGLNIDLAAGTYWIGLTPQIEFGLYGQEFHCNADSTNGGEGHLINPGGAFGLPAGTGWGGVSLQFGGAPFDLSMTIYGEKQSAVCPDDGCMIGDVNMDGVVDLLDVAPFVEKITMGIFCCEADVNEDGVVDLLDVAPFVALLTGG